MDQSADQNEIFYGMIVKFRKAIKKIFPVVAVILLIAFLLSRVFTADRSPAPEIRISAHEAKDHVNTPAEVCGEVASTAFVEELEGQPTFINFERPHPEQVFTVVIWGEYRQQWQNPPGNFTATNHYVSQDGLFCTTRFRKFLLELPVRFGFADQW